MRLVGRPELIDEPWFATGAERAEHADELDEAVGVVDRRARPRRGDRRVRGGAGRRRPDLRRRATSWPTRSSPRSGSDHRPSTDDELGPVRMQNVLFRLSETPGAIRCDRAAASARTPTRSSRELGVDADRARRLRAEGVVVTVRR